MNCPSPREYSSNCRTSFRFSPSAGTGTNAEHTEKLQDLDDRSGGAASDALVRRLGLKWGRRTLGIAGLVCAGLFTVAAMITRHQMTTVIFLSLVYGAITFQQSGVFGVCLDIGQKHAGAVVGLMNTSAQVGGLLSSVAYGYIVDSFGSYDAPFVPMAALLFFGALLWLKIDASKELRMELRAAPAPLSA